MKQIFTMLAVLVLAAALTACGEENPNNTGTADQDRPGTNQSQNAQRDDGAGGSWQNGTDTPAQPGASVGGAAGSQENTRDNARMGPQRPAAGRGEHCHLPSDAGERLRPRQRRLPQRRGEHQLVTARGAGKKHLPAPFCCQNTCGGTGFSSCPLAFSEK